MMRVGIVTELVRYPVKSMAGETTSAVSLDWQGIEGDRQFAFYRPGDKSRFPWLTSREVPELVRHEPRFREPAVPRHSQVDVRLPDGQWMALDDPRLVSSLSEAVADAVALMQLGRGAYDAMPISIMSSATFEALNQIHGSDLDQRRFRANIIVESDVRESEWVGRRLAFGGWEDSAELLVTEPIPRCALVTVDPTSAQRDPAVLRTVARSFDNLIGVYATTSRQGLIRRGDHVSLA